MELFSIFKKKNISQIDKELNELKEMVQTTYSILGSPKGEDNWFKITSSSLKEINNAKTDAQKKDVLLKVINIFLKNLDKYKEEQETNPSIECSGEIFSPFPKVMQELYAFFFNKKRELTEKS